MELPAGFCKRMKRMLGDEYVPFLLTYDTPPAVGLRYNPLRISKDRFLSLADFGLEPVPWCESGFYYDYATHPGRSFLHDIGCFYMQEPSAMAVAELLDPKPGERILDLCAAPGGKATQIAGKLMGKGQLVANEIVYDRARVLSQNMERLGVRNCIVTSNTPEELSHVFQSYFDRIVIDAPCSGEGMFQTKDTAISEWKEESAVLCAARDREIVNAALPMLKPGGVLVYSTCTFAIEENEEMVQWMVQEYPFLHPDAVAPDRMKQELSPGLNETAGVYRIFPHRQRGAGHFLVRLRRSGDGVYSERTTVVEKKGKRERTDPKLAAAVKSYQAFANDVRIVLPNGTEHHYHLKGETLYQTPLSETAQSGLRLLRNGLELGTLKNKRFEPAHALALALRTEEIGARVDLSDVADAKRYLGGNTIIAPINCKGWVLVTYKNLPLGWGKASGGVVKNHYPKGLRKDYAFSAI